MVVGSVAGIALAFVFAGAGTRLPGPDWPPVVVGLVVMCVGTALRYWSVLTLGRFFTVTVDIGEGHRVVDAGPYAVLRHPSYTGMLVVYLGIGVCLDSWLSVAAVVVLPALAVLNRIRHEEAVLVRQLGVDYERYRDRTKRLVPGLW
jgi:protein-S-isoprenylcysteine O-methyltransferase Ste14